jgi:outer membrane protein insertion porin family
MLKKGICSLVLFGFFFFLLPVPSFFPPLAQSPDSTETYIENIEVRGCRRVPPETVKHYMLSQKNAKLDEATLKRDFKAIWGTGFFEDVKIEIEKGKSGSIVIVWVKEKPMVREIKYQGLKSLTQTDILDKFKEKKVGLSLETPFDPTKVQRAVVVLTDMLAEKGRQYAEVKAEFADVPPNGKVVTFLINEGPKVKIAQINFQGNTVFSDKELRKVMKHIKQSGLIATFTGKTTYDKNKLEYCLYADQDSVTMLYRRKGYVKLLIQEPKIEVKDVTKTSFFPIPFKQKKSKRVYVDVSLEEGAQYRVGEVNFTGNTKFTKEQLLRVFGMQTGDVFNGELIKKGFDNLKKIYGALGYINWTPIPRQDFDDENKIANIVFDFDEGRPYILRNLEFAGNTTTRDKVMRREVLVYEGNVFNTQLWDISVMRLNQLGFFDKIDNEKDAEIKADPKPDTENPEYGNVDVVLKVKEKGKNSIGLNGGVSGYGGTFIGVNYSTNNFLGYGENLDVTLQGGTRQSAYVFSFTEPYFRDRPLTTGFSVFYRSYNYFTNDVYGSSYYSSTMGDQLYDRASAGFSVFGSYPIRPWTRFGLTYTLDRSATNFANPETEKFYNAFQYNDLFTGTGTYDKLVTSKIIPTLTYNTVDNPMQPSRGKSYMLALELAGGPFGGNVKYIKPIFQATYFRPMNKRRNTLGMRLQLAHVSGFGGLEAPYYERFYTGGEDTIRGFDIRTVSPLAMINERVPGYVAQQDEYGNTVLDPVSGEPRYVPSDTYRSYIYPIGGDTQAVFNMEYRIPIIGPVTLAPFADAGGSWLLNKHQAVLSTKSYPYLMDIVKNQYGYDTFVPHPADQPIDLVAGSSKLRASVGLEVQVIMPVVNAPFRLIFAYNPLRYSNIFYFPWNVTNIYVPWQQERSHDIKFSVGRTF